MENKYEVRRDWEIKSLGAPEQPIKPLFNSQKIYDFEVQTKTLTKDGTTYEYKTVKYIHPLFDTKCGAVCQFERRVEKINRTDVPDVYKNLEFFHAFNPFTSFDWDSEFNFDPINFDLGLIMFKLGYCDGFFISRHNSFGNIYDACPIICCDSERRESMRRFTEINWKKFLTKIDINDFVWTIQDDGHFLKFCTDFYIPSERKQNFTLCWDKTEEYVTEREKEKTNPEKEWDEMSHDDRIAGLSLIRFFEFVCGYFDEDSDYILSFKTEHDAQHLIEILKHNYTMYSEKSNRKRSLRVMPSSLIFQKNLLKYA